VQSGLWLLDRMRRQIGLDTLENIRLLDFGCGVRFSQAIVNTGFRIGAYTGVDNDRAMIEFLQRNVRDRRMSYVFLDAQHHLYDAAGRPMDFTTRLPLEEERYDIASMFSVITHQHPADSASIFALLRRYVRPGGHLFFTCFLDDAIPSFEDRSAEQNGGRCFYNTSFLKDLVESRGWREVNRAPGVNPLIGDSFVFRAAGTRS
jgi:SAM-dependent methyltransferase